MRKLWWNWINRRIPRSDEYRLGRRNIFVLPTGEGMVFGGLLVLCLLTGINYQNSLIYLFTFFLGTAFYGTIFQTYRNLDDLHVVVVSVGQGVAGDFLTLQLRLSGLDGVARPSLRIGFAGETPALVSVDEGASQAVSLPVRSQRRGYVTVPPVRIETDFPFGLIRAWTWIRPASRGVATPRPVQPTQILAGSDEDDSDQSSVTVQADGMADIRLRPYRTGDSLKRVSWKRFARTGHMTVADWEAPPSDPRWIDWDQYPGVDRELRLSYLAWQVDDAHEKTRSFGLKLPGTVLSPDSSEGHRERCLWQLGVFGEPGESLS